MVVNLCEQWRHASFSYIERCLRHWASPTLFRIDGQGVRKWCMARRPVMITMPCGPCKRSCTAWCGLRASREETGGLHPRVPLGAAGGRVERHVSGCLNAALSDANWASGGSRVFCRRANTRGEKRIGVALIFPHDKRKSL